MKEVILIQETDIAIADMAFNTIALCLGEAMAIAKASKEELARSLEGKKVVRVIVEVE